MIGFKSRKNFKKKILLVTRPIAPPWDEASKNFAYNLALNLPDFRFGLLTNGILKNLPKNIYQHPIYNSNKNNLIQKIKLILNLKKIAADYEIAHCLFTPTKLNTYWLKKILKNKKVVQTIATLREDLFSKKEIKKMIFGDAVVTYSKYSKDKLKNLGFSQVQQIYPGIDLNLYQPAAKDKDLIENLKLKLENFIVTYPGEFTRLGATDDIIDMTSKNAEILRKNKIIIVLAFRVKNNEDAKKKKKIEKRLNTEKISDLIRIPKTFTTLNKMLNSSDLIIFPVRDMFGKFDVPLAVIEAMACAKPVIISELPILREFSNNKNSVIIKSGNTKQLLEAILESIQNKEKYKMIGFEARRYVEENFDIKKIADSYRKIYNHL